MQNGHEVIAFGRTAELLAYGNQYVLKLFRSGIPIPLIEAEFSISNSVFHAGISSPQPVEIINHGDRKGIVYQKIQGMTMLKAISKKPWSFNKEATRMAEIHLKIHEKTILDLPKQKDKLRKELSKLQF